MTVELAMDCEMVGDYYNQDMLGRVSIVNSDLQCIYDKYVKPTNSVKDYRTEISGIQSHDMDNSESFETVKREIASIISGRVLLGYSIQHDLDVLSLSHPQHMIRNTQSFGLFKTLTSPHTPRLKDLAHRVLGIEIQKGEHSCVEDAMTTMKLYLKYENIWG